MNDGVCSMQARAQTPECSMQNRPGESRFLEGRGRRGEGSGKLSLTFFFGGGKMVVVVVVVEGVVVVKI